MKRRAVLLRQQSLLRSRFQLQVVQLAEWSVLLVVTHTDDSCGGRVFSGVCPFVCLSVCLFSARYPENRYS